MTNVSVIGLGSAGVNLASEFQKYPEYQVKKIDVEPSKEKCYFALKRQETPEYYQNNAPDLSDFFADLNEEILFIIGGGGYISAAAPPILEQIKHHKISILYIVPDLELLAKPRFLMERTARGILQEWARSGMFDRLILVSNVEVEKIIGGVSISQYYSKINEVIAYSVHMLNVFENSPAIMAHFSRPAAGARIQTIGVVDVENKEEEIFYPLENITEKQYYYAINKEQLNNDKALLGNIKSQLKSKIRENTKVSYGIYSTEINKNYAFLIARTPEIQSLMVD